MSTDRKFTEIRVFPKKATLYVRVLVALGVLFLAGNPVYEYLTDHSLMFKHVDVESGITCQISADKNKGEISCDKNVSIGLDLTEVDLLPKIWNYELGNGDWLNVKREGYSMGIIVKVKSNLFSDEIVSEIPYR
ncbi:hypothetical protein EA58_13790 [Photobacterium galatheae]|uniref:Uncharacterized protein n=2 Tax=Photobacterium galatheae TaxID=1654360 RepID=A0A066RTX4_9GAMM|nr:hypothetical protein EA58_13790 [Photobacterium galatheae]